jgi:hypothetical protein
MAEYRVFPKTEPINLTRASRILSIATLPVRCGRRVLNLARKPAGVVSARVRKQGRCQYG